MKKIFKFLVVVSFVFLLTSCGKEGEEKEIVLLGNDNNYYNWFCDVEDETILSVVSEKYYGEENSDTVEGLGGKYIFTIKALKKGETIVRFNFLKSWDDGEELYSYDVKVNVDEDLKINIIRETGSYLSLMKFMNVDRTILGLEEPFSEYVLYFSDDPVEFDEYECARLSVYTTDDKAVGYYAISLSGNEVFKVIDEEYVLLNGDNK